MLEGFFCIKGKSTFFLGFQEFIEFNVKFSFFGNSVGAPSTSNRKRLEFFDELSFGVEMIVELSHLTLVIVDDSISSGPTSSIDGMRILEMVFLWRGIGFEVDGSLE
jgi:hypothetical protein